MYIHVCVVELLLMNICIYTFTCLKHLPNLDIIYIYIYIYIYIHQ